MYMKLYYCFFFIAFACNKESNTLYTASLVNKTNHSIKIMFFNSGVVNPKDTIRLTANQSFEIANGSERGIITIPFFTSNYYGDSIWVIFRSLSASFSSSMVGSSLEVLRPPEFPPVFS